MKETQIQSGVVTVSADTVLRALNPLVEEGTLSSDDRAQLLWLIGEMRQSSLSLAEAGKRIGYDASTVSKVLGGTYKGSWSNVLESVRKYRHLQAERAKMVSAEFVETSIWERIRQTCDLALIHQMPAMIIGPSQLGKTRALLEYRRRSQFVVRYVRMPAAPGFRGAIEAIADACGVTTRITTEQLRRRIANALDERTLLVIDELHQLAISSGTHSAMKIMEYIRELHDVTQCGLVVCGTRALEHDLIQGPLKGWLEQFVERCIKRLDLPNDLPWSDILLVARAYGLDEPSEAIAETLRHLRMNRLVKVLALAGNLARKRDQPLAWEHFTTAYALVNR
ncbi:MAG: AAA family ATPase [Candidatus Spyradenecus sp.]